MRLLSELSQILVKQNSSGVDSNLQNEADSCMEEIADMLQAKESPEANALKDLDKKITDLKNVLNDQQKQSSLNSSSQFHQVLSQQIRTQKGLINEEKITEEQTIEIEQDSAAKMLQQRLEQHRQKQDQIVTSVKVHSKKKSKKPKQQVPEMPQVIIQPQNNIFKRQKRKPKVQYQKPKQSIEEEIQLQKEQRMLAEDTKQIQIVQHICQITSQLEQKRLLEEKKIAIDEQKLLELERKQAMKEINEYYNDKFSQFKKKMKQENKERRYAEDFQRHALQRIKNKLVEEKKKQLLQERFLLEQQTEEQTQMNTRDLEMQLINLYQS